MKSNVFLLLLCFITVLASIIPASAQVAFDVCGDSFENCKLKPTGDGQEYTGDCTAEAYQECLCANIPGMTAEFCRTLSTADITALLFKHGLLGNGSKNDNFNPSPTIPDPNVGRIDPIKKPVKPFPAVRDREIWGFLVDSTCLSAAEVYPCNGPMIVTMEFSNACGALAAFTDEGIGCAANYDPVYFDFLVQREPVEPNIYFIIDGVKWYIVVPDNGDVIPGTPVELDRDPRKRDPRKEMPDRPVDITWDNVIDIVYEDGTPVTYFEEERGVVTPGPLTIGHDENGQTIISFYTSSFVVTTDKSKAVSNKSVTIGDTTYYLAEPEIGGMSWNPIVTFEELSNIRFEPIDDDNHYRGIMIHPRREPVPIEPWDEPIPSDPILVERGDTLGGTIVSVTDKNGEPIVYWDEGKGFVDPGNLTITDTTNGTYIDFFGSSFEVTTDKSQAVGTDSVKIGDTTYHLAQPDIYEHMGSFNHIVTFKELSGMKFDYVESFTSTRSKR